MAIVASPGRQRSSAKDFVVQARLGKGAFGTVYKVTRRQDGKVYALKKISIGKMPRRDLMDTMGEVRCVNASLLWDAVSVCSRLSNPRAPARRALRSLVR
jgi:serine/threonine protein kinase